MTATSAAKTRALLATLRARRRTSRGGPILGAAVAAHLAGYFAGPAEVEPTQVGAVTHWGGWALESAFVGAVLVSCVVTFRVVELLFRADDAHALRTLPLHGRVVAQDRLRAATADAFVGVVVVALFLAPACFRSPPMYGVITAAYLAFSALLVPAIGFGLIVAAIVGVVDPRSAAARLTGGTIGGRGAVHHLAPGLAFGAVASALLLLKLGTEEPLRVWSESGTAAMTNAGWIGVGTPLVLGAAVLAVGLSGFARNFHEVQAALHDAEVPPPDTGYEYFRNRTQADWIERRVPRLVAVLYRKDRLQMGRGAPFLFPSTVLVAIVGGFVLWASNGGVLASGAAGTMLGLWLVVVVAPHRRLRRLPGEESFGLADMLAGGDPRSAARRLAAARLALQHALPLLLTSLAAGREAGAVAAGVLAGMAAIVVGLRGSREEPTWLAFAILVTAGVLAAQASSASALVVCLIALPVVVVGVFFLRVLQPARQLRVSG